MTTDKKLAERIAAPPAGEHALALQHKMTLADMLKASSGPWIYLSYQKAPSFFEDGDSRQPATVYLRIKRSDLVELNRSMLADAKTLQLHRHPAISIIADEEPNAAVSVAEKKHASIRIHTNMLERVSLNLMKSIVAHELGHVWQKEHGMDITPLLQRPWELIASESEFDRLIQKSRHHEFHADSISHSIHGQDMIEALKANLPIDRAKSMQNMPREAAVWDAAPHYASFELQRNKDHPGAYLRIAKLEGRDGVAEAMAEKPAYEAAKKQAMYQQLLSSLSHNAVAADGTYVAPPPNIGHKLRRKDTPQH